jgi:hypothetical protein
MDIGDIFVVACDLQSNGFSVIPSGGGETGKHPLIPWTEYQIRPPTKEEIDTWVDEYRPELWGIVTGRLADVFDCDTPEAAAPFEAAGLKPHVKTPRGGSHYYFKSPGQPVKTRAGILPGLDVRGDGGFVNIAGHNHAGDYQILTMPGPDNLYSWDQLPAVVLEAMKAPQKPVSKAEGTTIPNGQRNAALTSLAGTMRRRDMTEQAIAAALLETNAAQCTPPLPEDEVRGIAASVSRYPPANGSVTPIYVTTGGGVGYIESDEVRAIAASVVRYPPTNNVTRGGVGYIESDISNPSGTRTKLGHELGQPSVDSVSESDNSDIAGQVREWVSHTTGWWTNDEIDKELGFVTLMAKDYRGKILRRLKQEGILDQHLKVNKRWRFVDKSLMFLDFKGASSVGVLPVKWPLGIEKYVKLFPGNLAVVAGTQNAGKTALLLNFVKMNMKEYPIYYFCSEMQSDELQDRLLMFPGMTLDDWKFTAPERFSDFEDVIVPDCVNIVDFLEMTDELYRVNTHLTAISHKIGTGLAIVAIQKKEGAKFGRGQEFGLEKPKLYLSMDKGRLTIIKGKAWANPKVDPNGLSVGFKITGGCVFEITRPWDWKGD